MQQQQPRVNKPKRCTTKNRGIVATTTSRWQPCQCLAPGPVKGSSAATQRHSSSSPYYHHTVQERCHQPHPAKSCRRKCRSVPEPSTEHPSTTCSGVLHATTPIQITTAWGGPNLHKETTCLQGDRKCLQTGQHMAQLWQVMRHPTSAAAELCTASCSGVCL